MAGPERQQPSEIDREFPGLKRAVNRASMVTTSHFINYRPDAFEIRPPLVLFETNKLQEYVKKETEGRDYEQDRTRSVAHFETAGGVIYGSKQELQDKLKTGKQGIREVTRIIAEEYIHAFSTFREEDTIRAGFIHFPLIGQRHTLEPGGIYDETEYVPEYGSVPDFTVPAKDERLTENLTEVLLHHMATDLRPDLTQDYLYVILSTDKPSILPKNALGFDTLTKSLVAGDREMLVDHFGQRLLDVLETPGVTMVSTTTMAPRSNADILVLD